MAHPEEPTVHLSHEELMYEDHIRRASDFMKIDLFLSAKREYEKALGFKSNDVLALDQIAVCNKNLKRDRKTVLIVAPLVILVILAIAFL